MSLTNDPVVEAILSREPKWAIPVLKAVGIEASANDRRGYQHLTADYEGKRLRYRIIKTVFSEDRCEAMLHVQLDRIRNEGDPDYDEL